MIPIDRGEGGISPIEVISRIRTLFRDRLSAAILIELIKFDKYFQQ